MLAGWIDRPGILELHADASWNFDSTGFHVIGMYVGDVQIAHATAQRVAPTGVRIQEFHAILDVCASALPQCNPPVHIYRLRSDGIEELDNTKW